VALAAVWCLYLLIRRKGKLKNYLTTALFIGALVALVLGLDIQSPQAYYGNSAPAGEITGAVTLEIRRDTLTRIASGEYIPADGVILPKTTFPLHPGDTVYDLLTAAVRQYRLHLDASGSDGMKYVSGLNHLYEQAYGELSGWLYFVNGESASCSCDQYALTTISAGSIRWKWDRICRSPAIANGSRSGIAPGSFWQSKENPRSIRTLRGFSLFQSNCGTMTPPTQGIPAVHRKVSPPAPLVILIWQPVCGQLPPAPGRYPSTWGWW